MGEYNIGGDAFEIERILDKIGYDIVASFSGNGTAGQIKYSHEADLNLLQCHRSINYIAEMFEEKYGISWLKVNFLGVDATSIVNGCDIPEGGVKIPELQDTANSKATVALGKFASAKAAFQLKKIMR